MRSLQLIAQTYFDGSRYHTDGPYVIQINAGVITSVRATDVLPLPFEDLSADESMPEILPMPFVMPIPVEGPGDDGHGDKLVEEVFLKVKGGAGAAKRSWTLKQTAIVEGNRANLVLLDACPLDPHEETLHIRGLVRQGVLKLHHDPVHN